jgi:hypothetical protein
MSDTVMLTARTVFPPEVDISTVRLASRIVWPSETGHTITTPAMEKEGFVVPRPPGEVGRPHDGGFALKAVLGWSNKKYTSVRVRLHQPFSVLYHLDKHIHAEIPSGTGKAIPRHAPSLDAPR